MSDHHTPKHAHPGSVETTGKKPHLSTSHTTLAAMRRGSASVTPTECIVAAHDIDALSAYTGRLEAELAAYRAGLLISTPDGETFEIVSHDEWSGDNVPLNVRRSTSGAIGDGSPRYWYIERAFRSELRACPDGVYAVTTKKLGVASRKDHRTLLSRSGGSWWWDVNLTICADSDLAENPDPQRIGDLPTAR